MGDERQQDGEEQSRDHHKVLSVLMCHDGPEKSESRENGCGQRPWMRVSLESYAGRPPTAWTLAPPAQSVTVEDPSVQLWCRGQIVVQGEASSTHYSTSARHSLPTKQFRVSVQMAPECGSTPWADMPHWQVTALPQMSHHIDVPQQKAGPHGWHLAQPDETLGSMHARADQCDSTKKKQVTTLMICNVPCRCSPTSVSEAVVFAGFGGQFDFLYVPSSGPPPKHWASGIGYAFINFPSPEIANQFVEVFTGFRFFESESSKVVEVKSAVNQGVLANLLAIRALRMSRLHPSRQPYVAGEKVMKLFMEQRAHKFPKDQKDSARREHHHGQQRY